MSFRGEKDIKYIYVFCNFSLSVGESVVVADIDFVFFYCRPKVAEDKPAYMQFPEQPIQELPKDFPDQPKKANWGRFGM